MFVVSVTFQKKAAEWYKSAFLIYGYRVDATFKGTSKECYPNQLGPSGSYSLIPLYKSQCSIIRLWSSVF